MQDQRLCFGTCAILLLAACGEDPDMKAAPGSEMPVQMSADKPVASDAGNKATTSPDANKSKPATGGSASPTATSAGAGAAATSSMTAAAGAAAGSGSAGATSTSEMAAAGAGAAPASGGEAADPSPGCSGGTLMPGESMKMLGSHVYVQHIPEKYDGKTPMPVVLDLHGGSYDGPRWVDASGFKPLGDTEGFITLFPSGTDDSWLATEANSADGQFLKDLIAEIGKQGCIDKKRIYATGCSMGGAMSFWMGCFASDLIAAIAPMCGTPFFPLMECKPQRPFSVMLTIGETDNLNCWEGTPAGIGNPCAMTVLDHFKGLDMCTGDVKETHDGVCKTYDTCGASTEVTVCKSNTGHGVYQATNIEVTAESWKFLKRFHLP